MRSGSSWRRYAASSSCALFSGPPVRRTAVSGSGRATSGTAFAIVIERRRSSIWLRLKRGAPLGRLDHGIHVVAMPFERVVDDVERRDGELAERERFRIPSAETRLVDARAAAARGGMAQ